MAFWILILIFVALDPVLLIIQFTCLIVEILQVAELDHLSINLKVMMQQSSVQVAGGSHLVSFNCSFNVHFSFGHCNWVLVNLQFWSVSVESWQAICIWKYCWRWYFKHLGPWQGLNSKIFSSHRPFCPMPPLFLWNVNLYIILILIKCRSYGLKNFIWVLELLKNLNSQAFFYCCLSPSMKNKRSICHT